MADDNAFDMDAAYAAMRPHQRALFDLLGITAVGAKKIADSAVNAFDPRKGSPEGHLGRSIYLTNEAADAGANYAGTHGPDITSRIQRRAEQLIGDVHADRSLKWGSPEYDAAMEAARQRALAELAGSHDGAILPLYARNKNILDLTPEARPTWIDIEPKMNRHGDIVGDSPKMQAIERALTRAEADGIYDLNTSRVIGDIADNAYDGIRARDLDKMLRESEGLMYATDDTGNLMSSDIIRRIWQALGYRGVKIDPKEKFQNIKMPDGTQHLMMFEPRDLRSVNAAFSPSKKNSDDLLATRGGLPYVYGYTPPPPGEVY